MKTFKIATLIFILLSSLGISAQVFVDFNSQWSYFKGTSEPSRPNTLWIEPNFNDLSWPKGNAPFRYGDGQDGTELTDMMGKYTTLFVRKEFTVENVDLIDQFKIFADYDDGFVLWINGKMIFKRNAPNDFAYDQTAPGNHDSGEIESYIFTANNAELINGRNVIAIQGFNIISASTDFFLNFKLVGTAKLTQM